MGRNAKVSGPVHFSRANLDFKRLTVRPDDFCMQRLVAVRLRFGNIVVEASRQRHPDLMDNAKSMIAVGDSRDNHAQGNQIVDLAEIKCLLLHLIVNGVKMLGPPLKLGLNSLFRQPRFQRVGCNRNILFPLRPCPVQLLLQLGIRFGVKILKRQVFKLPLDLPDAEAVSKRGKNLKRFCGDFLLPVFGHRAECPHVMKPVSELDDHDPQVFCHCQQNFA